ncbi:MAG TPA: hypothetical protein VND90_01705 [Terracidiphilus sp.]|nr:hypothetical protein [Terracidiphilus sp.]
MFRPASARLLSALVAALGPCPAHRQLLFSASLALLVLSTVPSAPAQVITVDNNGNIVSSNANSDAYIDRRFRQVEPTKVDLPKEQMDSRTRLALIRVLQAQQGFAMRPIPRGHHGLILEANGKLDPAGEKYLSMVTSDGICAKPGDRIVVTDVKIEHSRIVLLLNGGPDFKHRFLRHLEIGGGSMMTPVVQDAEQNPQGARVTLAFRGAVPALNGDQVERLFAPLISFGVKTPVQAFTDTLPPTLKKAILDHTVLVGMSTDMVIFAMGRPEQKYHEMDGQMPVDIWVYGKPPQTVDFVHINGNRVIRVEIARVGQPLEVYDKDVVEGMMRTDGKPVLNPETNVHTVQLGDAQRNPNTQAPAPPPTLRDPGETLPTDDPNAQRVGVMRPVRFPQQKPDDDDAAAAARAPQPTSTAPANSSTTPAASGPQPSANSSATPSTPPAPTPNTQPQQFLPDVVN